MLPEQVMRVHCGAATPTGTLRARLRATQATAGDRPALNSPEGEFVIVCDQCP
jgi:hypothetical protein